MFGIKKTNKAEVKMPGPSAIPETVQKYLASDKKVDATLASLLRSVILRGSDGPSAYKIRIYDESDAIARKVDIKNYSSLDEHPDVILFEGSVNEVAKQVNLDEHRKTSSETKLFAEAEIRQRIESLSEPGSTVFFYQARGAGHGGPLGKGAAVIELNPLYPGKKQKKYIIYGADVVDLHPVGKGEKIFDSDKVKEIATWVKQSHEKRQYTS